MTECAHNPTLGSGPAGPVAIDVPRLLRSRLLVQANSGAGKSWALRRLIEQCAGLTQIIVIDPEGEFYTLREKFDFVLAGKDGECPADCKSAAKLATRLLELGVSGIVDIYELPPVKRVEFVARFLKAMVNAKKALWHDCLVIIDEAHVFAPQAGRAESLDAVIDLMSRGRKRGFCGVLATQRISKLHKDAAAEATNNKLIGRTALDVDLQRAGDELGMPRGDRNRLKLLKPGQFFAFGPAISDQVIEVEIGPVVTTHPEPGQRALPTPPPRETVRDVLSQLADLPHEIEQEERTIEGLEAELRKVQLELRRERDGKVDGHGASGIGQDDIDAAVEQVRSEWETAIERERLGFAEVFKAARGDVEIVRRWGIDVLELFSKLNPTLAVADHRLKVAIDDISREHHASEATVIAGQGDGSVRSRFDRPGKPTRAAEPVVPGKGIRGGGRKTDASPSRSVSSNGLPSGAARMLFALAKRYPMKFTKAQWGLLAGLRHSGGTFGTYLSKLRGDELIWEDGKLFWASERGLEHAGVTPSAPRNVVERVEMWREVLSGKVLEMFDVLVEARGELVSRESLAGDVGLTAGAGTFGTYLSKLSANGLIEKQGGAVCAARHLFTGN